MIVANLLEYLFKVLVFILRENAEMVYRILNTSSSSNLFIVNLKI